VHCAGDRADDLGNAEDVSATCLQGWS
jgi:hypothetical protein